MPTSQKSWPKLIALVILLFFSIFFGRDADDLNQPGDFWNALPVWLIGLLMGGLMNSMPSLTAQLEKFSHAFWRMLFGLGILFLIWYLPIQFPVLKKNDIGFHLDMQKSPAAFWMAAAFIFGYYRKLIAKIPAAVWNGLKAWWGRTSGSDLQGSDPYKPADVWNGLKCMAKDIFRRG